MPALQRTNKPLSFQWICRYRASRGVSAPTREKKRLPNSSHCHTHSTVTAVTQPLLLRHTLVICTDFGCEPRRDSLTLSVTIVPVAPFSISWASSTDFPDTELPSTESRTSPRLIPEAWSAPDPRSIFTICGQEPMGFRGEDSVGI